MDRSKWEVDNKTFGEVFNLFMGRTPSRDNDSYWQDGKYEWLSIGDMGDTKYLSKTKEMISEEAVANMQQVPENTVVMSFKLSIGKVGITSIPLYTNEAIMAFPPKEGYQIMPTFLYYYLQAYKWQPANRAVMGKTLNKAVISSARISIPSVADQQRIVAELDCLNEMIAVKQEQLKEFDKLAQSIFYDMFGDPVSNEKGWKTNKLGELGLLARGVSKHRPRNAPELLGGTMPLIQTGDVANAEMYITTYNSTYSDLGVSQSKVWKAGTLCITIAATIGKCAILSFDACFPDSVVGFMAESSKTNNEYMFFIFKCLQKILEMNAPAVAQKNINLAVLNALQIPLPPLSLQQQFAEKISAIEAQKELVKQSIAETQALLSYTMDKYFGYD